MPTRHFRYSCCIMGGGGTTPTCVTHGEAGIFVGWRPTEGERFAIYVRVFGLAPVGIHHDLARALLEPLRRTCPACRGRGWLGRQDDASPVPCPGCDNTGGLWTRPIEEVVARRDLVLMAFPEAATTWDAGTRLVGGA